MSLPRPILFAAAVLTTLACATTTAGKGSGDGGGAKIPRGGRLHLAGEPMPVPNVMPEGEIRERYREALMAEQRAHEADDAGKKGEARAAYVQAADGFLGFVNKYTGTNWDEAFRYHAATLYEEAGRLPQAVSTAETLAENAKDPMSKALGWLLSANARVKVKDLRPLRVIALEDRKEPPTPKEPPSVWKSFTDAAREALAAPPLAVVGEEPKRTPNLAQVVLVAGQAEFAFDRFEPARALLGAAIDRSATEPEVFAAAAPLYLRTWADAGDVAGYEAALAKLRAEAGEPGGPRAKALASAEFSIRYGLARKLVDQGEFAEAALAFEALAASGAGDAAPALDGAAFAQEKAGDLKKAAALRERLLAEHKDAEGAPAATLGLASLRSRLGDHAAAAKAYEAYLQRWPEGPQRCAALRNSAIATDQAEQWLEAAQRWQRFGADAPCTKDAADAAVLAHHRAGLLYGFVKKKAEAKAAFQAALAVEGATGAEAQAALADAKKRAK